MKNDVFGRGFKESSHGPVFETCAPHSILTRLGDKWTIMILSVMSFSPEAPIRFSDIKRGINGISQRMLTLSLRHLERDGLLTRQIWPEVPPRVEYTLTPLGKSLLPALEGFTLWIRQNWPAIEEARLNYDNEHQQDEQE